MKFLHPDRLLVCLMLIFCSQFVQAQKAISEKITENLTQIQSTTLYTPLEAATADELKNRITDDVLSRKQFFQLQNQIIQTIKNNDSEYLRITIPIAGEDTELQLTKLKVFTDEFRAVATSNPDVDLNIDTGTHYHGTVKDADKSIAVISFFDDEMIGLIQSDNVQYTLGKVSDSDYHILYQNNDLDFAPDFSCDTREEGKPGIIGDNISVEKSMMGCIRVHVEADYLLYQYLGSSVNNTTNYISGVFAEVATMYANESITTQVSFLRVWDTPSPYNSFESALDDLDAQNYGRTSGDLVHLVHRFGGGGVAWLNSLCSNFRNTGVSGVFGSYNNVPTYSWDVNVITHELGHNLGSPHTHACFWNGNSTQIDDCGNKYLDEDGDPDTDANSCYNSGNQILPSSGTVMSYCHLYGSIGVDFNLGFGTQPGNYIRSRVNAASCLTSCGPPTCDDGFQNGDETGVDCGGSTCPACPTCSDNTQNGEETGVDCGGPTCQPCPCNGNLLAVVINLDNYPEETTWLIRDASGTTVASGGAYGSQPDGSMVIENPCLDNGCYTFTINDSYGDGICCGFGNGSYSVVDTEGNTLASGGAFGSSETTNFCVNGATGWQTCDPTIDLGTETLSTGTVHAQNELISSGTVPAQANVSLKAGQNIRLDSGFNIDADADVEINIEDCVPD